jgi:hypothetical protein
MGDINVAGTLLHGEAQAAFGDAGYQGVHKLAKPKCRLGSGEASAQAQDAQPLHRATAHGRAAWRR